MDGDDIPAPAPAPAAAAGPVSADQLARRTFVDDFSSLWSASGAPRMEGRVLAHLMVSDAPHVSTTELMEALGASAGSVSTTTRYLVEAGFIRRERVPGERTHHFRADDDVWGGWLASERRYLGRQRAVIERALAALGADDTVSRRRLTNGRNYLEWVAGYHRRMLADWQEHKAANAGWTAGGRAGDERDGDGALPPDVADEVAEAPDER